MSPQEIIDHYTKHGWFYVEVEDLEAWYKRNPFYKGLWVANYNSLKVFLREIARPKCWQVVGFACPLYLDLTKPNGVLFRYKDHALIFKLSL